MAEKVGVKIFTADIIYHLFDQFTAYLQELHEQAKEAAAEKVVFPCRLKVRSFSAARSCCIGITPEIAAFSQIMPEFVINRKAPIIMGVEIVAGQLKMGTPICVPAKEVRHPAHVRLVSRCCVVDCAGAPVPDAGPHRFDRGG